jgi:hypothetical protein
MRCLQKSRSIHNEYYFYSILNIAFMLREDINSFRLRQAGCILCLAIYLNFSSWIIYKLRWRLSREIVIEFWKKQNHIFMLLFRVNFACICEFFICSLFIAWNLWNRICCICNIFIHIFAYVIFHIQWRYS